MCYSSQHFLDNAWHQLGNTLSPQQALFGLCSALSTSNYAYDFHSILQVLQRDALDLTRTQFTIVDGYLKANYSSSSLLDFVPPTFPFFHSIQSDLYHAPRNLVFRSPAAQQVVSYLRHETYSVSQACSPCGR